MMGSSNAGSTASGPRGLAIVVFRLLRGFHHQRGVRTAATDSIRAGSCADRKRCQPAAVHFSMIRSITANRTDLPWVEIRATPTG